MANSDDSSRLTNKNITPLLQDYRMRIDPYPFEDWIDPAGFLTVHFDPKVEQPYDEYTTSITNVTWYPDVEHALIYLISYKTHQPDMPRRHTLTLYNSTADKQLIHFFVEQERITGLVQVQGQGRNYLPSTERKEIMEVSNMNNDKIQSSKVVNQKNGYIENVIRNGDKLEAASKSDGFLTITTSQGDFVLEDIYITNDTPKNYQYSIVEKYRPDPNNDRTIEVRVYNFHPTEKVSLAIDRVERKYF